MNDHLLTSLARLIEASLPLWHLVGRLKIDGPAISVQVTDDPILISRAPDGMPFRWVITHLSRKRTAASVSGVLRITRQILAPDYQPLRLRIAPQPITLPPDATQKVGS